MFKRWSKRLTWLVMLCILSLVPSQLARGPGLNTPVDDAVHPAPFGPAFFVGVLLACLGTSMLLLRGFRRFRN